MTCYLCGREFSPDCAACVARRAPNTRDPTPQLRNVEHAHLLRWGDGVASYLECARCGLGFSRNAKMLDLMRPCPAVAGRDGAGAEAA